jgi:hypothetical protein
MFMPKQGISVTLETDNLLWLRTQAAAGRRRSLSETLDRLVTEARLGGRVTEGAVRSVVGTIDISEDDPDLAGADEYLSGLFQRSARQLVVVRERPPKYGARARGRSRRG